MKKLVALFLALIMVLSLAACGGAPAEEAPKADAPAAEAPKAEEPKAEEPAAEKLKIGIFVKDNTNPFWRYVVKGAMQAGEDLGVEVIEYTPAEASNVEQQVSLVQDAIQAKLDGIAIVAVDSNALLDSCKQAKEAGIVVIPFNSRMDDLGAETFVGIDNYTGMKGLMEELVKKLDGKGKVVILEGVLAGYANQERMRAVNEVLAANPGIEVVADQAADAQREKAITVMENILQANPEIDAVIGHNDNTALGAYQAVLDAGREDEMIITGFDAQEELLRYLAAGDERVAMSVDQSPFMQGYSGVESVVKVLRGEAVEEWVPTGGSLVTTANAQEVLDKFYN